MATALCDIYSDYATAHTAIELIDDSKVIAVFAFNSGGGKDEIVVVRKA